MIVFSILRRAIISIFLRLLEKGISTKPVNPGEIQYSKIRQIIIIRQHGSLEDLLLSTPVFRAVRQRFPNAFIATLTRSDLAPILNHNVLLDDVLCFYNRLTGWSLQKIFVFIKQLRTKYDLAIVLNTDSHSLKSDLLAYFSGARYILGSEHLIFPECKKNFFYNLVAPYSEFNKHQTERNLDILRYIDLDSEDLSEVINLTKEEKKQAIEYLNEHGLQPNDMILALNIEGGRDINCWEVDKHVEVAKYFSTKYNAKILVFWYSGELDLRLEFINGLPFKPIEVLGLELREFAAVLHFCNILICYDSEIMHLAASVGTPLVAIFARTDPQQWKPLGQQFMALRGEDGLCSSINEEQVITLAGKLIEDYPKSLKIDVTDFDISDEVLQDYLNILDSFEE